MKDPTLIPIVGHLDNIEKGGESVLLTFNLFINTHDQQDTRNTNFILEAQMGKPPTFSITTKLYLQIVCKYQLAGEFNPQVSQLQLKDDTTLWIMPATIDKDATTPFLPATTGRRL